MSKLKIGDILPNFIYDTPFSKNISFAEQAELKKKTALIFLRYYGCTVSQYDIHQLLDNYQDIAGEAGQLFVILQSDPQNMKQQISQETFPFDIICDPDQMLYRQFEVSVAASEDELITEEEYAEIADEVEKYQHGEYEGEELQLPAVVIVDSNMKISYAHYGKSLADIPTVKELTELMR